MFSSSIFIKLSFFLLFLSSSNDAVSSFSDKSTLLRFKASLSDPSAVLSTWSSTANHCSFYGVLCDSNSRVVALNITGNGGVEDGKLISHPCSDFYKFPLYGFGIRRICVGFKGSLFGKLPSLISELTELRVLSLPGLESFILKDIWNMEKLEVLDLEGNLIGGSIPLSFEGLRKLREA